jgi:hypothetical protein
MHACAALLCAATHWPGHTMAILVASKLQPITADAAAECVIIIIIIIPCKPYLSASATAPHPLGRRKAAAAAECVIQLTYVHHVCFK